MDKEFRVQCALENDRSPLPGGTVLVVDDDEMVRELLSKILLRWGCSVDVAVHGIDALRCLARRAYDVILTDIQMPLLDGLSLWRQASACGHSGRWILMTGAATAELEHTIQVLRKPLRLNELRDALILPPPIAALCR